MMLKEKTPWKKLPEYSIPHDLENVLRQDTKASNLVGQKAKLFLSVLETLKDVNYLNLSEINYLQLLKLGLYLEEYHRNLEMKKYEIKDKRIERFKGANTFQIYVENLDEENPWINSGDFIDIPIRNYVSTTYILTLTVISISLNRITAVDDDNERFSAIYTQYPEQLYDIKFRFQNYPLRCSHYALDLTYENNIKTFLFPSTNKSYIKKKSSNYKDFNCINPTINAEQKQAVANIVLCSAYPAPYILYGPPGTGKTATLVEAICQARRKHPHCSILVCTPSNTAADLITKRLLEYESADHIYRIYSRSKNITTIDEEIQQCCNFENGQIVMSNETIEQKKIIISTLCNCMKLVLMNLRKDKFLYVFIDEAGQAIEPDILIPINLVSQNGNIFSQIVLAGDPQQLGPTVMSKLAGNLLGRSILERLMSQEFYKKGKNNCYDPSYITKLIKNYRSHPNIINISNKLFYDDELISEYPHQTSKQKFPILFHGIKGKEEKESHSPSVYNYKEIVQVLNYVDKLIGDTGMSPKDVGIVTPFSLQSNKIKKILKSKKLEDIQVGTVELFQGQERKIIIMTAVRSKTLFHNGQEHIGFLSHPKRFNVALTRAKERLIVVGNPSVLQLDYQWWYLLQCCIDNKSYQGFKFVLKQINEEQKGVFQVEEIIAPSSLFKMPLKMFEELYDSNSIITPRSQSNWNNNNVNFTVTPRSYSNWNNDYAKDTATTRSQPQSSSSSRRKCNIL